MATTVAPQEEEPVRAVFKGIKLSLDNRKASGYAHVYVERKNSPGTPYLVWIKGQEHG